MGRDPMRVVCPICNERVEGEGENDLSLNLQDHFASAHGFKGLCDLTGGTVAPQGDACVRTESGEMADLPYDERRVEEAHRPEGQVFPGEDVLGSVRCPICGRVVLGHAFDDLSYNLSKHLSREHAVKVSWLGKG